MRVCVRLEEMFSDSFSIGLLLSLWSIKMLLKIHLSENISNASAAKRALAKA
jgi:hypothetical protein